MQLVINGKNETVTLTEFTIRELLKVKKVATPEMVSVELNGRILRQVEYESAKVSEGDQIEFLYFMGGGICSCDS